VWWAGWGQLSVLLASALVPLRLNWRQELATLPPLLRQLFWVYGGYVVLAIIGLGLLSLGFAQEIALGSPFARGWCAFAAIFWGVRLSLQGVLAARPYLTAWWLWLGEAVLTVWFAAFTAIFAYAALR
jgi:hypothetical protein